MKIYILYFSGTGNTRLIAEALTDSLLSFGTEVTVLSIEELEGTENIDFNNSILGIGFPVYKLTYPRIMEKLIGCISASISRRAAPLCFIFSTFCRFPGSGLRDMAKTMRRAGCGPVIASTSFKCPSNGISSLQNRDDPEFRNVMYFENFISRKLTEFSREIAEAAETYFSEIPYKNHSRPPGQFLSGLRTQIADKVEKARYPELSIDVKVCTHCGVCVKNCPERNLLMEEGRVLIKDTKDCLHCLRCLHRCPVKAISFGPLVQGHSRYTSNIRQQLYRQACEAPPDAPEAGSKKIWRKWARGNVRYWLLGR